MTVLWFVRVVAFALACLTIFSAWYSFIRPTLGRSAAGVREGVSFNAVIFSVLGALVTVIATDAWPVALLWDGGCLLVGGFVGLLFGVPLGEKANSSQNANAVNPPTSPSGQRTLVAQAADSLSKFLAGAAAVKYNDIYTEFKHVAARLADCLKCCGIGNSSFAAGLIVYFLAVGFLAGLLLPRFYNLDGDKPPV